MYALSQCGRPIRKYGAGTGTPNGWKVSILLKELKYPHKVRCISLSDCEQKESWFTRINPNGQIPAIGVNRVRWPQLS